MTDNGYDRRTDSSADGWHVEGRRNGGPGSDWTVNAVHLPTGTSWLSLQAHSYDAGRQECIKAIREQIARTDQAQVAATIAGQNAALTAPEVDWRPVS